MFVMTMLALASLDAPAATWLTSYDTAHRTAAARDRPIVLCFSPAVRPEQCPELRGVPAEGRFVRVFVSKATPLGRRVYNLFGIAGDNACVVVERGLQFQYCRYERTLSAEEWQSVASTIVEAKGRPVVDPLEPAVALVPSERRDEVLSAYVPAAVAVPATPAAHSPRLEAIPSPGPLPSCQAHWLTPTPITCSCRNGCCGAAPN